MAKVTMKLLTELMHEEYQERGIAFKVKNTPVYYASPLISLSNAQTDILNDGDGQITGQYKQINSSTGLAVNYYKILENLGKISDLIFENKVARPLNRGGRHANLDVSYKRDGVIYFVESKFLEPYYGGNENIKDSYFDVSKYPLEVKNHQSEWHDLFMHSKKISYYNFSQLCRHLLAIYRYTHGIKHSNYQGEPVILQSVTWEMTDNFMEKLEESNRRDMKDRNDMLRKENEECQKIISSFINQIRWNNMNFQTLHYNDMLEDIKSSKFYKDFCKRYFFE